MQKSAPSVLSESNEIILLKEIHLQAYLFLLTHQRLGKVRGLDFIQGFVSSAGYI